MGTTLKGYPVLLNTKYSYAASSYGVSVSFNAQEGSNQVFSHTIAEKIFGDEGAIIESYKSNFKIKNLLH